MSLLPDYSRQALTYDNTGAASPSVLGPLQAALKGAPGKRLADIGGGTGNYAAVRVEDAPCAARRGPRSNPGLQGVGARMEQGLNVNWVRV